METLLIIGAIALIIDLFMFDLLLTRIVVGMLLVVAIFYVIVVTIAYVTMYLGGTA